MTPTISPRTGDSQESVTRRNRRWTALMLAVGLAVVAIWVTYPGIGQVTYSAMIAAESRLDGLRTRHADVDGLQMAYYEGGPDTAPTIVMLHGFSADRNVWIRFASHLDEEYHVVIPDLAGHGDTPFVKGADYSAAAQADRVAGLLDVLDVKRAHVIGNSMGGFIAARFAYQYPQRTLSLGLSNAAGITAPHPSAMQKLLARGENPFLFSDPAEFKRFYPMTMAKPPYVPGFVKDAMAHDYASRKPELTEIFKDLTTGLLDGHLARISVPAYVLWGDQDQLVDPSAAKVWAAGLPHATLVTYPGIGHMPMLEIPERSARDYRRFLAGLN